MKLNYVAKGDCIPLLGELDAASVDLVFADPPFNIGYEYDGYKDTKNDNEYRKWLGQWIEESRRVLKPHGSIWIAMGDEFVADVATALRLSGFHQRNWVVWYYTFGVNCQRKFNRSHTHLLYYTKHRTKFTFNKPAVAVPSERERRYNDKRAAAGGKVPDNTWILNPADFGAFNPDEDTMHFPRVCGTFKEREGWHGCQMPVTLMHRIIECCTDEGDTVVDPFAGSGTTLAAAKGLNRNWIGFDVSDKYVKLSRTRVKQTVAGVAIGSSRLAGH